MTEEPSYGSGNGIAELEGTGSATNVGLSQSINNPDNNTGPAVNVSPMTRHVPRRHRPSPSRTPGGNYAGLNFVAYAEDAVSYLNWNEFDGAKTESSKCLSAIQTSGGVTTTDLKDIWNETYTGNTPSLTWSDLDPSSTACTSAPVYAYWAQSGSGTQKTWASATGATYPEWDVPLEATSSSRTRRRGSCPTRPAAPIGDAIFFFSYGDYLHKCTPSVTTPGDTGYLQSNNPDCAGTSTTTTANQVQLGTTWVGATSNVTLDPTTVNAQLPGQETAEFPGDRLLYNVYSDGSNPNIPVSNDATLNFVSEDGFLCKPGTATEVDPNTGLTFRSEIDSNLANNGFLPLPALEVEDGQGDRAVATTPRKSGIPHPAYNELHNSAYDSAKETSAPYNFAAADVDTDSTAWSGTYQADDGSATPSTQVASGTAPIGYCITMTTDGDTAGNG